MPHDRYTSFSTQPNSPVPRTSSAQSEQADRELRLERLREQIRKLPEGEQILKQSAHLPGEVMEFFLRNILTLEQEDDTTYAELLRRQGIRLIPPEELEESMVHTELWRLIHGLARQQTFLERTDHLSDRELYLELWNNCLPSGASDLEGQLNAQCVIDLLGGGSDEDIQIDLKYYADEMDRESWMEAFPDSILPPKEPLPYDRDRQLPKFVFPQRAPENDPEAG